MHIVSLCVFHCYSVWSNTTGQSLWHGWCVAWWLHNTHHERSGSGWNLCCIGYDLCHCKYDWITTNSANKTQQYKIFSHFPHMICDFFFHRWFWFNRLRFWLLHHSLCRYQPRYSVLHNPPQTGEHNSISCNQDNLMTSRLGNNHVTHLSLSCRNFTSTTRRKARTIQHYKRREKSN